MLPIVDFRQPVIAEIVQFFGGIPEERFKQAHGILGIILPPVGGHGIIAFVGPFFVIRLQGMIRGARRFKIAGPDMPQEAMVRGSLNIRFAPQRIHTPAYPSRVAPLPGAGDAFCGGFLVGLSETGDVLEAGLRGSVSASLAIEGVGALSAMGAAPGLPQARLEALQSRARLI